MNLSLDPLWGRRTLVIGGVKSGKTRLACAFVEKVLAKREERVTVLDFAPDLYRGVGGKMILSDHPRLRYLTASITAPRLRGQNTAEVLSLAEGNRWRIETLLESYRAAPDPVLVINDATLYLHAGTAARLMEVAGAAATLLVNAYCGEDFREVFLSTREREELEIFMTFFERIVRMEGGRIVE
ncbi:MAG: hypothetical protein GXY54_10225 [Deltaproteobacteria bacterium]|nr:hypothetical protein [Deltaproteobacteria bacterium]